MKKIIAYLNSFLSGEHNRSELAGQDSPSKDENMFLFESSSHSAPTKADAERSKQSSSVMDFDHESTCREIVGTWVERGVSLTTLTPDDVFYSGQLSQSPGPISLDHKIIEYDAGLWLSRHLMYASCYTDFSSSVDPDQIRSKHLFKVRPAIDFKVVLFADGAPHPAPVGRRINGLNSDLYIAQQWPRLLNELCRLKPEFTGAHGHLRESDRLTSELWLYNTKILRVDQVLDVTQEKHWDRVKRYGNGSEESETRAKLALFDKVAQDLLPSMPNELHNPRPRQTIR